MTERPICQRCRKEPATVISRKERFSNDCFLRFVSQKQRKQMMSDPYFQDIFKVIYQDKVKTVEGADLQNAQSNILVPLSFGSSSLVMLDVLNETLTEQKETQRGKTGFQIDVLICYQNQEEKEDFRRLADELHNKRYSCNKEKLRFHMIGLDTFYTCREESLQLLILDNQRLKAMMTDYNVDTAGIYTMEQLLAQCPDRSSREDILTFIKRHLIKKFAYQNKHKAILWGNSMTKLADETISLIVKGRGGQIPTLLDSSRFDHYYGDGFKNLFPLRDILLSEVDAYCYIAELDSLLYNYRPQDTLFIQKNQNRAGPVSNKLIKSMTLNEIARKYFDDIEIDYSNVISTVVRTADKLADPPSFSSGNAKLDECIMCLGNIHSDGSKWLADITTNEGHPITDNMEQEIFDEWESSLVSNKVEEYERLKGYVSNHGHDVPICYGCIIIFDRLRNKSVAWPRQSKSELNCVLDEYVLTDDEG